MKYTKSHYNIAMDEYRQSNYRNVIKELNIYLRENKKNGIDAKGLFVFAKAYDKLKMKEESIKIYKIILKLDPNNVHARLELGKLYASQGKDKEAEKLFQECMQLDSNNVHARLELGKLYASQGKDKEAEKLFQECMQLDSNNVHARLELGKLYASQGKDKEAEKLFQECMQLDSNNVHARLELGKLYASQGKDKEAEKLFQECMQLDSNNVHARLELGKLYADQGKTELSKEMYNYIIDSLGKEAFDETNRVKHIMKHMKDDKTKKKHGVFLVNPVQLLEEIKKQMKQENKRIGYMSDVYLVELKGCGYEGGYEGDGHALDYVTLITLPDSDIPITMFPSDNVFELNKFKIPDDTADEYDDR